MLSGLTKDLRKRWVQGPLSPQHPSCLSDGEHVCPCPLGARAVLPFLPKVEVEEPAYKMHIK